MNIYFPGSRDAMLSESIQKLNEGEIIRSSKYADMHRELDSARKNWHNAYKARKKTQDHVSHDDIMAEKNAADHFEKTFSKHHDEAKKRGDDAKMKELVQHHSIEYNSRRANIHTLKKPHMQLPASRVVATAMASGGALAIGHPVLAAGIAALGGASFAKYAYHGARSAQHNRRDHSWMIRSKYELRNYKGKKQ